jgi:hypothetical protein
LGVSGALILWEVLAALQTPSSLANLWTNLASAFKVTEGHWLMFIALFLNTLAWTVGPAILIWYHRGIALPPSEWALHVFLALIGTHYFCRYSIYAGSTELLLLLVGIWIGEAWRVLWPESSSSAASPGLWSCTLVLALLSQYNWPVFHVYNYHGARRSTGLWANPNTYGLLCASVAASCLAWYFKLDSWHKQMTKISTVGLLPFRQNLWLVLSPLPLALLGLVRSYSRGAWLGFAVAVVWCGWLRFSHAILSVRDGAIAGDMAARRRWLVVRFSIVFLLIAVVGVPWHSKDSQNPLLRRLGSIANQTDRSWRNRVDAWVGAVRMTTARPVTGWGLTTVENIYDFEFKPFNLNESAAIQLNDYLTLAAGMGWPALTLFLLLIASRLRVAHRELNPNVAPLLVLLVGSWFDGVLFRLALAIPFWILLLAGTRYQLR